MTHGETMILTRSSGKLISSPNTPLKNECYGIESAEFAEIRSFHSVELLLAAKTPC